MRLHRSGVAWFVALGVASQLAACATSHPCVANNARRAKARRSIVRERIPEPPPPEDLGSHVYAAMSCDVDPCEDFYEYACGGYLTSVQAGRDDRDMAAGIAQIRERNQVIAHGILLVASQTKDQSKERELLGSFYDACMAQDAVDAPGLEALAPRFAAIEAITTAREAVAVMAQLQGIGVDAFFAIGVTSDPRDPALGMLAISQPSSEVAIEHLRGAVERSGEYAAAYREYIDRLLVASGVPAVAVRKQSADAYAIERALAEKARTATEHQQGWQLEIATFAELDARDGGFPWLDFAAAHGFPTVARVAFDPRYLAHIEKTFVAADLEAVAAYLRWRTVATFVRDGSAATRSAHRWFEGEVLYEIPSNVVFAHWAHCVDRANAWIPELVAQYYVQLELPPTSRDLAAELAARVKRGFADRVAGRPWLDPAAREHALGKLEALDIRVGHPDGWRAYDSVELGRVDHLANVIRLAAIEHDLALYRVGRPRDAEAWPSPPIVANATYQPSYNSATLNAGLLQWPLFRASQPMVVNFAGIGAITGHEIGHAFDKGSIDTDAQGRDRPWLIDYNRAAFETGVHCIVEDLEQRTASEGTRTIGQLTRDEAIADLAGVRAAHTAWQSWQAEHPPQRPAVAGLTDEQLFFLAFAQSHCRHGTAAFERVAALTDPHADDRVRVNATLSHVPELAEAFACAPDTPMHPSTTCEVW